MVGHLPPAGLAAAAHSRGRTTAGGRAADRDRAPGRGVLPERRHGCWPGGSAPGTRTSRHKHRGRKVRPEQAFCAEVVATTLQDMGVLALDRRAQWFDPGTFWSGDFLPLTNGWDYGREVKVGSPAGRAPAPSARDRSRSLPRTARRAVSEPHARRNVALPPPRSRVARDTPAGGAPATFRTPKSGLATAAQRLPRPRSTHPQPTSRSFPPGPTRNPSSTKRQRSGGHHDQPTPRRVRSDDPRRGRPAARPQHPDQDPARAP